MTTTALNSESIFFHRDYENDLPKPEHLQTHLIFSNFNYEKVCSIYSAALPLLCFWKPVNHLLTVTSNGLRGLSCSAALIQSIQKGDKAEISLSLFNLAMSISAIAGMVFFNPLGMVITTCHDISLNSYHIYRAFDEKDSKKFDKQATQLANNCLQLLTIVYGGITLQIGSRVMRIVLTGYLATEDYKEGNHIEFGLRAATVAINIHQLQPELALFQKKYKLQSFRQELSKLFLKTASYLTEPLCYIHKIGNLIDPHKNELDWIKKGNPVLTKIPNKYFSAAVRTTQVISLVIALPLAGVGEIFRIGGSALQTEGFCYRQGNALEKTFNATNTIKTMTFNICGIGAGYEITNGNQVPWELRLDAIIKEIENADADVVCLQEVFDSALGDCLYERLKDRYAHFYTDIGTWAICPSGYMFISKIPGKMSFTSFKSFSGDGKFQNKGFTSYEIHDSITNNIALIIASVHLQHDDGIIEECEIAREEQILQVNSYFKATLNKFSDLCCVFMGDLNIEKGSKEYENSTLRGFTDPREYSGSLENDYTCSNRAVKQVYDPQAEYSKEMLDYIVYKGAIPSHISVNKQSFDQTLQDPTKIASDHIPLVATIKLKDKEK